ncbi:alpha/beta hydrolase [Polynucleobacter sp. JS-Mosq-20-D10]|uniref:alpha/beta fold hydrolase n=1 Tax=Polynucleobacter sp. JS-Mosq-20-D10 TaxID=2576922 RepID=UPI001BFE665E|nr:alpha/beta hydrolase [Polynucleobacter sp. JS-Mosq-20-D10]QWE00959.1 alpha/beta hydrolase [Polynucleobacter sp. JS-Mosq-20-D10]
MSLVQFYPNVIDSSSDLVKLESLSCIHKQDFEGNQIIWRVWGQGSPLVLLHGGSGSWNHWCRNIKTLIGLQRQVWIPDIPCFGDSDAPDGVVDIDQASEVLLNAFDKFFPEKKIDLIGFSMGSMGAGYIAKKLPERINQLLLVAPPALGISPLESIVIEDWTTASDTQSRDQRIRNNLSSLMLWSEAAITDLSLDIHRENLLKDRMRKRKIYKTDFLMDILKKLEVPFYCILGSQDALYRGNLEMVKSALVAIEMNQSLDLIEDAGHWVQFEKSTQFNEILKRILV